MDSLNVILIFHKKKKEILLRLFRNVLCILFQFYLAIFVSDIKKNYINYAKTYNTIVGKMKD